MNPLTHDKKIHAKAGTMTILAMLVILLVLCILPLIFFDRVIFPLLGI